jgi:hypothetical protein
MQIDYLVAGFLGQPRPICDRRLSVEMPPSQANLPRLVNKADFFGRQKRGSIRLSMLKLTNIMRHPGSHEDSGVRVESKTC